MTYGTFNSGLVFSRYGVYLAILLSTLYFLFIRPGFKKPDSLIEYWYLASISFVFIGSSLTMNTEILLSSLNFFIFSILLFFLFISILSHDLSSTIKTFAILNIAVAAIAILIGIALFSFEKLTFLFITLEYDIFWSKRMNSWFNNSTVLGFYICICSCFLYYLDNKRLINKFLYLLILALFITGLVLTGGRTGALLAVISLALMKFNFSRRLISGILFISLASSLIFLYFDYLVENIYFFRRLINFDSGFGGRAELANQTFELLAFYDLPSILFGKGIGSTAIIHNISIHSGSLRQILELGIPFMILNLFIGLYIVLYARITNSRKYKNELRLGSTLMFALIIGDLMITSLWGVSLMSLFYCFALCILIVVLREKKSGTV